MWSGVLNPHRWSPSLCPLEEAWGRQRAPSVPLGGVLIKPTADKHWGAGGLRSVFTKGCAEIYGQ